METCGRKKPENQARRARLDQSTKRQRPHPDTHTHTPEADNHTHRRDRPPRRPTARALETFTLHLSGCFPGCLHDLGGASTVQSQGFVLMGNTLAVLPPGCRLPIINRNPRRAVPAMLSPMPSGGASTGSSTDRFIKLLRIRLSSENEDSRFDARPCVSAPGRVLQPRWHASIRTTTLTRDHEALFVRTQAASNRRTGRSMS